MESGAEWAIAGRGKVWLCYFAVAFCYPFCNSFDIELGLDRKLARREVILEAGYT